MNQITVTLSRDYVVEHCTLQANYHKQNMDEKSKLLSQLEPLLAKVRSGHKMDNDEMALMSKTGYSFSNTETIEEINNDIRNHDKKARRFSFLAENATNKEYVLTLVECESLELIPKLGRF